MQNHVSQEPDMGRDGRTNPTAVPSHQSVQSEGVERNDGAAPLVVSTSQPQALKNISNSPGKRIRQRKRSLDEASADAGDTAAAATSSVAEKKKKRQKIWGLF